MANVGLIKILYLIEIFVDFYLDNKASDILILAQLG